MNPVEFIRQNGTIRYFAIMRHNQRYLQITYTVGGERRTYDPLDYLDCVLENHYLSIDSIKSPISKYVKCLEAKSDLIHTIEEFKKNCPDCICDYSGVLIKVNATEDLLRKVCDSIKLDREMNFWKDPRFWYGFVAGLAPFVYTILKPIYKLP